MSNTYETMLKQLFDNYFDRYSGLNRWYAYWGEYHGKHTIAECIFSKWSKVINGRLDQLVGVAPSVAPDKKYTYVDHLNVKCQVTFDTASFLLSLSYTPIKRMAWLKEISERDSIGNIYAIEIENEDEWKSHIFLCEIIDGNMIGILDSNASESPNASPNVANVTDVANVMTSFTRPRYRVFSLEDFKNDMKRQLRPKSNAKSSFSVWRATAQSHQASIRFDTLCSFIQGHTDISDENFSVLYDFPFSKE